MAREIFEIRDVYNTITRPVNMKIASEIAARIGFDPKVIPEMPGSDEFMMVRGSNMETDERTNIYPSTSRAQITVREEYTDRTLMSNNVLYTDHDTVFSDPNLKMFITPHYRQMEVTVTMTVRCRDQVTAEAIRAAMQTRIDQTVFNTIHDVKYFYNIPPAVMMLLLDTHRRREAVAGYGDNLAEWFNRCFTRNWRITTAQNGMGAAVTIGEGQVRIHGWFEGDPNTPQFDPYGDKEGPWVVDVEYKYWYERPETLVVTYPYMVHTQLCPNEYIDYTVPKEFGMVGARQSRLETILQPFTSQFNYGNSWLHTPGIPIPYWDDWLAPNPVNIKHYMTQFRLLSHPDIDDNKRIGNLLESIEPEWTLWPEAVAYMQATHEYITKPYANVFSLQVFEWDELRDMKDTKMTKYLDIVFDEDLSLRNNYHATISFLTDPSLLTLQGKKDLANNWCFGYRYFKMLWPNIINKYPPPDTTCMTDLSVIDKIIEDMAKEYELTAPPPNPNWPLAGNFFIKSKRK